MPSHSSHSSTIPSFRPRVGGHGGLHLVQEACKQGLQTPVGGSETSPSEDTNPFPPPSNQRTMRPFGHPSQRNAPKTGHRKSVQTILSGILQPTFCHPQSFRGVPPYPRPLPPEQVLEIHEVQDGVSRDNPGRNPTRRLGLFPRPERCVFPHPDTPIGQEMVKVHVEGEGLPVQGITVRAQPLSLGFHTSGARSPISLQTLEDPVSCLQG